MDGKLEATLLLLLLTSTVVIIILATRRRRSKSGVSRLPPGPWKLPVIGNLHQMLAGGGDRHLPHRRLAHLATRYGPLMQIQLGEIPSVVVSSPEWARAIMQAHDLNFATRPVLPSVAIIFYGCRDIAFAAYGEYWREMRKVCAVELLGPRRAQQLGPIMEEEMAQMVKRISSSSSSSSLLCDNPSTTSVTQGTTTTRPCMLSSSCVNLTQMLLSLGNAITSRAAFGKAQRQEDVFLPFIEQMVNTLGGFTFGDLFPSWKLLRRVVGTEKKLKELHGAADVVLEGIISDHLAKRSVVAADDDDDQDLVDVLLNLKEDKHLGYTFSNSEIKAVILDLFLAGTETWTVTVEWAMSQLMKNPRIMEKAQREVRHVVAGAAGGGNSRKIDAATVDELGYLQLVVKETLRLHPPGPLTIPRECRETIVIDGYRIPAKTRVIVNAWAIGRDPRHWVEPEKFHPERFLDLAIDYKGLDFEFIPFGSGRRVCPGMQYAVSSINLALANLLYHFDWKLPNGIQPQDFDMSEGFGIEVKRKNELFLIPVPSHASNTSA
ncbi:unnamed protein product [Linum tenue]|uniref:Uncharacterized protein n=1 Tax=Linum tenue TaxID=586396 RepID=A0AAV0M422_9ROSI|nr:unnamed protein product [Linum tenue]